MADNQLFDVVVVGSGAGGGTFAQVNPSQTTVATTLRVGDHVIGRLR